MVEDADQRVTTTIVHRTYLDWCDGEGELAVAPTARKFVPELRRLGLAVGEGHSRTRQIVGFGLRGEDGELLSFPRRKVL